MLNEVHVPVEPRAAAALVAAGAVPVGGGTAVMPQLNDYASPPTELVSLRRLGLDHVDVEAGVVRLGAATTLARIGGDDRLALLHGVVRSIASLPVRTLATVAGNLFVPQPYGDLAVAMVALDARVGFLEGSGRDTRTVPVEDVVGTVDVRTRGLATDVHFLHPASRPEPVEFRYYKVSRRKFNSASIVTIAACLSQHDGVVTSCRVALGGVGRRVIRAHGVERTILGSPLSAAVFEEAAETGLGEIDPQDDAYASAWYRARVFPVHLKRALLPSGTGDVA